MFPKNYRLQNSIRGNNAEGVANRIFPAEYRIQPDLADVDLVLDGQATSATVITEVEAFLAQPDVPRQIVVTPGGTTGDVAAGDVDIEGTNIAGDVITESLTFEADQSTAETTVKAFATITKITFPIQDGAAATFDVGSGPKVGVPHILGGAAAANSIISTLFDGSSDAGTWTVDADELEKNVYAAAGTFDGAKWLELRYWLGLRAAV